VYAITFQGVERLVYERVPDPGLRAPTDAIVRVRAAGLCGSDLHPYFGRETGLDAGTVMGHELVGEVVEVGPAVREVAAGDRVVAPFSTSCGACFYCREGLTARCAHGQLFGWVQGGVGLHGAQAEWVRVPFADATLVPVPEGLDEVVALLAGDVLATAMFGVEQAGVRPGDLVVVVGCGPVGLLAVRAALAAGAREVVAVDPVAGRLELAERWGAVGAPPGDARESEATAVGAKRGRAGGPQTGRSIPPLHPVPGPSRRVHPCRRDRPKRVEAAVSRSGSPNDFSSPVAPAGGNRRSPDHHRSRGVRLR